MLVRLMEYEDLVAVYRVQSLAYVAAMVEAPEILAQRLTSAPDCSWVAEEGGEVIAYLAAYPSVLGRISALGQEFQVAEFANALYLHDLAVSPHGMGRGVAQAMLEFAVCHAQQQGWSYVCLVSVQNTRGFWQRQGFSEQNNLNGEQAGKLASYAGPAVYMVRNLRKV